MADDRMDDNRRGLSPEEIDAIMEKYDNGEISESELADALGNAGTDMNFTDDFSDKFFTDKIGIDPNTIREESVERNVDGRFDDDASDPFNDEVVLDESEKSAGSGSGLSRKKDIPEDGENTPVKKSTKKKPKKSTKKTPIVPTSPDKAHADTPTDPESPVDTGAPGSRSVSHPQSLPLDDEDGKEIDTEEELDEETTEDLEEETDEDIEEDADDSLGESSPPEGEEDSTPSPFDSPVMLSDEEKKRITPTGKRKRKSPGTTPFGTKDSPSKDKNDKPSISPFGDPSGLGDNAKDANIGKNKAPNIWAQRFAALTAASQQDQQEDTNEDYEGTNSEKKQGKDQNADVPQKKKKAPALIALGLAAAMVFPLTMMMSGTMNNQILGASGGVCSDGVSTDDINKKGVRGVPEGETSNPEIMPPGRLTSPFGPRDGEDHKGQDLATGGDKVGLYAYYDGVVSVVKDNDGGFGYYVIVDHQNEDGEPFTSLYGHMFPNDILVEVGDTVEAGQLLAYEGYNGGVRPPGPAGQHLHFEIAPGVSGGSHFYNQVDPAPYLEDSLNPNPDGAGGTSGGDSDDDENDAEDAENANQQLTFGLPRAQADETSSSPTTSSEEDDLPPATFIIGDNIGKNAEGQLSEAFQGNAATNMSGDDIDFDKVIEAIENSKEEISDPEYKYVVIQGGTYGGVTPEKYEKAVNIIKEANPDVKVVGVTVALADEHDEKYNSVKDHMQETNKIIKEKSDVIADWSSESKKGDDFLEKNGVKVSSAGAEKYAETIFKSILKGSAKDALFGTNENVCCSGGESKKNKNGTYNSNSEGNASDINEEMEKNAETIAAVLDELGMGGDKEALRIAYIGALGESSLTNKANDGRQAGQLGSNQPSLTQAQIAETLNYPHVGEDSPLAVTGIYQQTIQWWGTVEDLMQPAYQAAQYLTEMKKKNPDYKNENFFKVITVTQVQEIWDPGKAPEAHDTYQVYNQHVATADKLVEKYLDNHRDLTDKEKKLVEKGKKNREGEGGGDSSSSGSSSNSKNKNNANSKCKASDSSQSGSLPKDAKERVEKVIEEARRIGAKRLPWQMGANDPNTAMDCSGYISYVWNKATGIKFGRSTMSMKDNFDKIGGLEVDREDIQPGDIMLWSGHVAMVVDKDTMIEAGNPVGSEGPIRETNLDHEFYGYYRVSSLPEELEKKGMSEDDLEVSGIAG